MREATLIYPHQLFKTHPALAKDQAVYVIEESLFLTEFPVHAQKLLLHRLSMRAYAQMLTSSGYSVTYLSVHEYSTTAAVFERIAQDGITDVFCVDTTDTWLEKRIHKAAEQHAFTLHRFESPLFLLKKDDAVQRYTKSGKHMARFYKQLRIDTQTLLEKDGTPTGGQWSFDADNRKKIPKNTVLPTDINYLETTPEIEEALEWLQRIPTEYYGVPKVWLGWTHTAAEHALKEFLAERFTHFGDFEDAIDPEHTRLFHSALSPYINCGLLTPQDVIDAALAYAKKHDVPLNTVEGFVRQVLGWREFIRASYECDGIKMRTTNFWKHSTKIPASLWDGTTTLVPLDAAIHRALRFGYNHHIERLMVLGNFMLLSHIHPDEVYRWFMAMYVDAYDWVMVPNVYGMSQFADGGIFATKPYISGSSYIKKMSSYKSGAWEETWTTLYWNFIATHASFFLSNHRLSMMPRLLEKMPQAKREAYLKHAHTFLKDL